MELDILNNLFSKITEVTGVEDIGYHRIGEGRLNPFHKTNTDILGIERWKKVHGENPVFIDETFILEEVTKTKQPVWIYDTNNDSRSASAFFLFGVDSILIVPVVRADEVKSIVCIVTIGKLHDFTMEEITSCDNLVKEYLKEWY